MRSEFLISRTNGFTPLGDSGRRQRVQGLDDTALDFEIDVYK
jgi:hypothetical protein